MKIIFATAVYPPEIDRLAVYSRQLADNLKGDHRVTILAYANKKYEDDMLVVGKDNPLLFRLGVYTWQLLKLSKKADLIFVQNSLATSLPAILVKYLNRKPVLINYFEDEAYKRAYNLKLSKKSLVEFLSEKQQSKKIKRWLKLQKWVFSRASKVVVSSKALAEVLSKYYQVDKQKIVVNYLPEDRQEKLDFQYKKEDRQIFIKGELVSYSGIEELINLLGECQAKILISGDGPDKEKLARKIKELNLENKVTLLGKISKAQNWYLLKNSKLYLHNFLDFDPNYQITQSMLAGTMVLARDTDFNKEILEDKHLFNSDNLIAKVNQVLDKDDSTAVQVDQRFAWPEHIKNLNKIFASIYDK